jgi:hypothetical protein
MARLRSLPLVLVLLVALGAATSVAQDASIYDARFSIEGLTLSGPSQLPAGMTTITIQHGADRDDLVALLSISGGRTLDDFFTTMGELMAGELAVIPSWIHFHGGAPVGPGVTRSYTLFLGPGTYYLLSLEGDDEGPFAARGLLLPVEVTAPSVAADVIITLHDYEFVIEGTLAAGSQMLEVRNAANQPHEVLFIPLPPGVSLEEMFASGPPEGQEAEAGLPTGAIEGLFAIDPGITAYVPVTLAPGTYALVCFVPDADGPHAMQGMAMEVTIQ